MADREQFPTDKTAGTRRTEKSDITDLPQREARDAHDVTGGRAPTNEAPPPDEEPAGEQV